MTHGGGLNKHMHCKVYCKLIIAVVNKCQKFQSSSNQN